MPVGAGPASECPSVMPHKYRPMNETMVRAHLRKSPPACIGGFRAAHGKLPETVGSAFRIVWKIACGCGNDSGALLGYPLKDLVADETSDVFVSPLAFECMSCNKVTELLDTDQHGYHAEVGKLEGIQESAKIRGAGPRQKFVCPKCRRSQFSFVLGFVYWNFDLMIDDPELPGENFFNEFLLYVTCTACGHVSEPTEFGKL